jgi:hypothetical protein
MAVAPAPALSLAAAAFGATQVCVNSVLVTWAVLERDLDLAGAGLLAATAQGAGLLARPLTETVTATREWLVSDTRSVKWVRTLTKEKEQSILSAM